MRYVINAFSATMLPDRGAIVEFRPITPEEARRLLEGEPWASAVGHEGTAQALSALLGLEIPANRQAIALQPGDSAILSAFPPGTRLPEGRVLSREEVEALGLRLWEVRIK